MPVWDVSRLPEPDQFDYWREVICQAFVPLTPGRKNGGPGFAWRVETRPLVGINRARIASQAQTTRHGRREVAATDDAFYFMNLQLAGRCRTRVGATDTVVGPGQFVWWTPPSPTTSTSTTTGGCSRSGFRTGWSAPGRLAPRPASVCRSTAAGSAEWSPP